MAPTRLRDDDIGPGDRQSGAHVQRGRYDEAESRSNPQTGRGYYWKRYGPLRLVAPWVAIVFGIAITISYAGRAGNGGPDTVVFFGGPALVVLGVAAFFLYRCMAKRGI